jgi:protein arginine kinase activator
MISILLADGFLMKEYIMKCDICKTRDAVIFLQQVTSDSRNEIHLCLECARERGFYTDGEKIELSFAALLSDLLTQKIYAESEKNCPVCGTTLSRVVKNRVLGCPECYTYFSAEIKDIQKKQGIKGVWTGTLPERLGKQKSTLGDRMLLQLKLEESLTREDYEKAAIYRDRLRLLENPEYAARMRGSIEQAGVKPAGD